VRLAGLKFAIGGHLHLHIPPGVGSFVTHFPFGVFASILTREIAIKNGKRTPGCAYGLILGLFGCTVAMEISLIVGFVEN
jgi:hypothetical protein